MSIKREIWGVLAVLLGLNLWMTLCLLPLQIEWTSHDMSGFVALAYFLPLALLAGGVLVRWSGLMLFLFPSSFLLVYFILPELDRLPYEQPTGWFSLGASLLAYIITASLWIGSRKPQKQRGKKLISVPGTSTLPDIDKVRDGRELEASFVAPSRKWSRLWWPYKNHFVPRGIALVLLLVIPIYGLNFAEDVQALYKESFQAQATQAQVMADLLFLFVWIVIAYLLFLSPGLNLELEQREMDEALARYEERALRRPNAWIFVGAAAGAVVLMAALIALRVL